MMNMLPNRKDRRISFSAAKKKLLKGFTLVELFITIMIMGIIAGGLVAMTGSFEHRRRLDSSALKLQEDLRLAQTYSMGAGGNYRHYGVLFSDNLGPNNDRQGWKIVCYCDCGSPPFPYRCTTPCTASLTPPLANNAPYEVIKSSEEEDNADLFDNTFFAERVTIDASNPSSTFQLNERIVFTEQRGSATCNGTDLLGTANCPKTDIVLTAFGGRTGTVPLRITPLTGHVRELP